MGMFDNVFDVPPISCPDCGEPVDGWQSKDGPCELGHVLMAQINNFYTNCRKCDCWIEFDRIIPAPPSVLKDFRMTWKPWESRR